MDTAKPNLPPGPGPAHYNFSLKPRRFFSKLSHCPDCERALESRKLPFLITIEPNITTVFSMDSHYCPACDWLILDQHKLEGLLAAFCMRQKLRSVIGNDYEVSGTVEEEAWRRGMQQGLEIEQLQPYFHPFKEVRPIKRARRDLTLTVGAPVKKVEPTPSKHLSRRQRKKGKRK
ncbi:MAG: hypothetical protein AB1801_09415 [Chloroflexota bacterium]